MILSYPSGNDNTASVTEDDDNDNTQDSRLELRGKVQAALPHQLELVRGLSFPDKQRKCKADRKQPGVNEKY